MHLALFLLLADDPPTVAKSATVETKRLAVALNQAAYERARADFAEAAHRATLADAAAARAREWLEMALKAEPGYKAGCDWDKTTAKMVCAK